MFAGSGCPDINIFDSSRCSGITRGRELNGELYAQRLQKLIYLHLFPDCFMEIFLQSSEQISSDDWIG